MSIHVKTCIFLVLIAIVANRADAKENIPGSGKTAVGYKAMASNCNPASAQIDLDINNVRTTLLNGGDKWWDLTDARYEVPKIDPPGSAPSVHALFAGAIWLGGIDAGGSLRMAAQTYRQSGNDFWPGPLDNVASTTVTECNDYNRFWQVKGADIDAMLALGEPPYPRGAIPQSILEWPAKGNPDAKSATGGFLLINEEMAPFYDHDGDGLYNPEAGDYPVINPDCGEVYADQMIFWVYNDKGNLHTETGGLAIGIQINALAFAFATSDEVNDMTFYRYKIINKATSPINEFYMAQWVDADLGCFNNDYVGVDTARSLGICYNGTAVDPDCATRGYGQNPPLVGVDFFEGPLGDADSNGVQTQLGMSAFTYYNNDFTVQGNPEAAVHFYNYMTGKWKDGTCFTKDRCNAYGGSDCTNFMFPGSPNQSPFPQFWSECSCNNPPADRRFLQASGPFTLLPGAVNNITVGVVWVRPVGVYPCPPFETTIGPASDKAQALFDNCFKLVDGPDAPTLAIRELDQEIIISIINEPTSNNVNESYNEADPVAVALSENDPTISDTTYTFQGYKLYQLRNAQVSVQELEDVSKARLIAQVDVRDNVAKIINYTFDPALNADVPKLMVDGENTGIRKTFKITEDRFATGSQTLINHKTYYYTAIAYAYNNYKPYDVATGLGQNTPFLQGRRNYKVYSAIPHMWESSRGGTDLYSSYGDGVKITRLEGRGNGGQNLDLTEESIENILNSPDNFFENIEYKEGRGPIDVKVYDPMKVKNATFELKMIDPVGASYNIRGQNNSSFISPTATWELLVTDVEDNTTAIIFSENDIEDVNEQLVPDYGISISLRQVTLAGKAPDNAAVSTTAGFIPANGFIGATIQYRNQEPRWLSGVQDEGTFSARNWIRSGQYAGGENDQFDGFYDDHKHAFLNNPDSYYDNDQVFTNVLNGTWAPYGLSANWVNKALSDALPFPFSGFSLGPAFPWRHTRNFNQSAQFRITENTLHNLQSVDVVFTSDKSKWTRCVVVELGEDSLLNQNFAYKGQIRMAPSWDKNGFYHGTNQLPLDTGRSWFPGYAINLETGERLNMMFGEDSWLVGENGRDMIWNPTSNAEGLFESVFGGRHYVYVMTTRYDEGETMQRIMLDNFNKLQNITGGVNPVQLNPLNELIYKDIMWVSMTHLADGGSLLSPQNGIIPNDVTVKLRVNVPYQKFVVDNSNNGVPKYAFSTEALSARLNQVETAKTACDQIRVVPNPYYAYSAYENSQLDNRVKITNLPDNCTVTIFTIGGTKIRQYNRAIASDISVGNATDEGLNLDNTIDWDLKNDKGIPIASGVYLIHVQANGVCERVVKWFGSLRPIDLDTF